MADCSSSNALNFCNVIQNSQLDANDPVHNGVGLGGGGGGYGFGGHMKISPPSSNQVHGQSIDINENHEREDSLSSSSVESLNARSE